MHIFTSHRSRWLRTASVLAGGSVMLAASLLGSPTAGATSLPHLPSASLFVGTSSDDSGYVNSACSSSTNTTCTLRDAVDTANTLSGVVDITFNESTDGHPIVLTDGEIDVDSSGTVTIEGQGSNQTVVSGDDHSEVFEIDETYITIEDMTIEKGYGGDGGAIYNYGYYRTDMTVSHVVFSDNIGTEDGGAIYDDESQETQVIDSTFTGNEGSYEGGGIYSYESDFGLSGSTFSKNRAEYGAGVTVEYGDANIDGNTFVDNTADYWGDGGGMYSYESDMDVYSNTFDANVAGGGAGLYTDEDEMYLYNDTIANNVAEGLAGGLEAYESDVVVRGSILSGNTDLLDHGPSQCYNYDGITSDGYNVVGPDVDETCVFHGPRDVTSANAGLKSLASNGGPTQTMALTASSPAVLRVPESDCQATDQRGVSSPATGLQFCDAGAYELTPSTSSLTCSSSVSGTSLTVTGCSPSSTDYKSASLSETSPGDYVLTWKSSGKKTDLELVESSPVGSSCAPGSSEEGYLGAVTGGSAANTHVLDKVSFDECVTAGAPAIYTLAPGTKAKF